MVAKKFVADVSEKAMGEEVMKSLTPGQMVIKIVNEEMVKLISSNEQKLKIALFLVCPSFHFKQFFLDCFLFCAKS